MYYCDRSYQLVVWPGDAGRGRHPPGQVLRGGARLQRDGDGAARAQSRGPLQLLQQKTQSQDSAAAGRPAGEYHLESRYYFTDETFV